MVAHGGVGLIAHEVPVEAVIAAIGQGRRDTPALGVQAVQVKVHARAQPGQGARHGQPAPQGRVPDVEHQVAHPVERARVHLIAQAHAPAPHALAEGDTRVEIAHAAHGPLHVGTGAAAQDRVIDDGGLAQAAQEAVEAPGAVGAREAIDGQRHRHGREPAAVGALAHKPLQRLGAQPRAVGRYAHTLKQIGALGDEAVYAARGGREDCQGTEHRPEKPMWGFHRCKGSARRAEHKGKREENERDLPAPQEGGGVSARRHAWAIAAACMGHRGGMHGPSRRHASPPPPATRRRKWVPTMARPHKKPYLCHASAWPPARAAQKTRPGLAAGENTEK